MDDILDSPVPDDVDDLLTEISVISLIPVNTADEDQQEELIDRFSSYFVWQVSSLILTSQKQ